MSKKREKRNTKDKRRATNKAPAASERGRSNRQSSIVNRQSKRKRLPISAIRLKRLAFSCEHLAEADQAVNVKRSLADCIASHDKLAAAWDRGQLLRNLEGCAAAIMTVTQAAKLLGFESGQKLRELLDTDGEVRDLWEQKRIGTIYAAKAALADAAKDGNQAAIKAVEVFFRDEGEGGAAVRVDYGRLGMKEMAELFGVTRQSVYEWYTKQGLARNADGTFDLKAAISWFEQFTLKKASKGREILGQPDPLRSIKAQQLALELDHRRGKLLDRESVVAGQVARFRNLIDALGKLGREVAPMLVNQTLDRMREIVGAWTNNIIVAQRQIPEELELDPPAAAALAKVYEIIGTENTEDRREVNDGTARR